MSKKVIIYFLIAFSLVFAIAFLTYIPAQTSYRIAKSGGTENITAWGICRKVTNNSYFYDLFVPVATETEWLTFLSSYPSSVTVAFCGCSSGQTTNWAAGPEGCSATSQRCYQGVCRNCPSYEGFYAYGVLASDNCNGCAGQGGMVCWRGIAVDTTCNTGCDIYGGCVQANWNDNSSCTAYLSACSTCNSANSNSAPRYLATADSYGGYIYDCYYRVTASQSCGALPSSGQNRTCVCQY